MTREYLTPQHFQRRQVEALESIAASLEKLANPLFVLTGPPDVHDKDSDDAAG